MSMNNDVQLSFQTKHGIIFRIGTWLATIFVITFITRYTLKYWISILFGFLTCISIAFYLIIGDSSVKPIPNYSKKSTRFSFVDEEKWSHELHKLYKDTRMLNEPVIEQSFLISETLEDFINLIIKEFIDSWFVQISNSTVFQDSIRQELKYVIRNLHERFTQLDFAKLLVFRILPIIHDHFNHFVKIQHGIRLNGNTSKLPTGSMEYAIAAARQYDRGKVHPGVTVSMNSNDVNEKKHLRNKVDSILPHLLSPEENTNKAGTSLVKEIISCTILSRVIHLLGDGDFYNLLIVNLIGDNIKHREQVKQLRAALEEHTRSLKRQTSKGISMTASSEYLQNYKRINKNSTIQKNMDNHSFNEALQCVSKVSSVAELKHLSSYTGFQLSRVKDENPGSSKEINVLLSRLNLLKSKIDNKLAQLSITSEKKIHKDEDAANLTLLDILNNSVGLKFFTEFMNDRSRSQLFQLWLAIDEIRAPLEDIDIEEDGEARLSLSLEFSNLGDIVEIYREFFQNSSLEIDRDVFNRVESFVNNKDPIYKLELYQKSRKALFKLQNNIYESISNDDFPPFKKSELFLKLLETHIFDSKPDEINSPMSWSSSGKRKIKQISDPLEDSSESEADEVSPGVIKAVEDAFTQIMNSSDDKKSEIISDSKNSNSRSSSADIAESTSNNPISTIHLKKDLFGESSNLFTDDSVNFSNGNRNSKLFDDISDHSFSDSDSINFDSDSQNQNINLSNPSHSDSQIFLAAPGNLRLAEEISKLSEEIDKLSEQQAVLSPLLKKAELTNNVGELKILRKSKVSLDREINAKELQKQQFIVQENDNSLYGKSRVSIQSYISNNENGKNYILYIVEVQKLSSENQNNVTAGWIVARRFSQFFRLNEYLKSRYPLVVNIKFPKRTVSVLKFQQKQIVEQRKALLEEYLQQLLKIPEVCSNKVFRSFLSSENFTSRNSQSIDGNTNVNLSKLRNSVEIVANKLYNGISGKISSNSLSNADKSFPLPDQPMEKYMKDMQKELRQFDESEHTNSIEKPVFVKPVCDLLISVFRLNTPKSWLRGRALLVILHQVFGNTLEKKAYEVIDFFLRTEENVLDLLIWGKNIIFPMGRLMEPPEPRNSYQRSTTKQEAKALLEIFMQETCSKIFGLANTTYACNNIFELLQNGFLNKHLILQIFDEIINQLFPEASTDVSSVSV
ncbi:DEHA2F07480p [Debaryomyces hansenii CBS767]|uniref:DEHA2F07480p n=1 Tax=Debaryomyces hansenii (strain ATCC 36239 / CBS 767 / BCRC 21394 / JCM 1990 / NBRC 0083 / IGC 2968) TaxID=284592 RepID=Q6BM88_DEBHA|nr:DEHA2F07480p [Debaryomyces hansenii CBS767]CAG89020.2 DEHA2F07480p [Debaryomyces hansenii CBS767]|eukprot:XP_460683.2 DEHA2F07480p [Debaryomyces hansenii CBS767]